LQKTGKADPSQIQQVRNLVALEQKKIEMAFNRAEEESKTDQETVND
jgi:hypothetical protein